MLGCLAVIAGGCAAPAEDGAGGAPVENPIASYEPNAAGRADVVAVLQRLFDALETGDDELLRTVMDPGIVMHYAETRDGATTFGRSSLDALAERITTSDVPLIERMWDPVVVVEGPLAVIWTPYDFYAGEAFSHCGVDTASLMRTEEGWRIVGLSWTREQPPACTLHPDGPPR